MNKHHGYYLEAISSYETNYSLFLVAKFLYSKYVLFENKSVETRRDLRWTLC